MAPTAWRTGRPPAQLCRHGAGRSVCKALKKKTGHIVTHFLRIFLYFELAHRLYIGCIFILIRGSGRLVTFAQVQAHQDVASSVDENVVCLTGRINVIASARFFPGACLLLPNISMICAARENLQNACMYLYHISVNFKLAVDW